MVPSITNSQKIDYQHDQIRGYQTYIRKLEDVIIDLMSGFDNSSISNERMEEIEKLYDQLQQTRGG